MTVEIRLKVIFLPLKLINCNIYFAIVYSSDSGGVNAQCFV